ncbi:DUF1553 domain-containing protein [uncultured Rubinisphaera sp.]|uniref:DUF1553 domain-containing protein n=1 Tax=uncultured Rubinisphaera sp. TaxID=1678686 RepID=UPI0030D900E5
MMTDSESMPHLSLYLSGLIVGLFISFTAQCSLAGDIDYLTDIKPLLESKCYSCHGVLKQEAELRLETRVLMLQGGDSGSAIESGRPEASLLMERITDEEDSRMPPAEEGSALKHDEIELIRKWIKQGAVAPEESTPKPPTEHWAFRKIKKPDLPSQRSLSSDNQTNIISHHPIDGLLELKRGELSLKTQPAAPRSILIRRVYLDLIGLPPTLEQLQDDRPWEDIVDELLASPHYGERWGRHWMDVWRYSDWYGLGQQLRYSQKHLWRWRDWIVNSLNEDLGYDHMIEQMLAGDEIAPDDPKVIAATGFLARNYYLFNRTTWLDSTIEHTGKAFLGLTLNCAKCHDHKYDPISQVDYYNFRAIFEPHQVRLDPVPGVTDFEQDGLPRVFDDHLDVKTFLHVKGDPKNPDENISITPRVPELFASYQPSIMPIDLPVTAYVPSLRKYVQNDHLAKANSFLETAQQELTSKTKKRSEKGNEPFEFVDSFDQPDPLNWVIIGDSWEYKDGKLQRSTSTREPEAIRFKHNLPDNFEVTCRYTATGGTTYKSVTFRFDQSDDYSYNNFVYTSAHEPDPKIQAAFTRKGSTSYPGDGRIARPLEVGRSYEIRFAVRDRLMNVWLDGEFVLAYQFPDRHPDGHFAISGFDATVAFEEISIRSLAPEIELTSPKSNPNSSSQTPEHVVKLAEAKLALAQANLKSLHATIEADEARYADSPAADNSIAAQQAAFMQAKAMLASAQYDLIKAGGDEKKQKTAEEKLKQAEANLTAAKSGEFQYKTLRASQKALETPADKMEDYPATYAATSTGRRTSLAKWITSSENPLTARVAVNHVWMRHFGKPLVDSVFDFGLRAKRPVQADLLDHLAAEFMEHNWSFKHLHRLIVTSQAYQLSSSTRDADAMTLATDATNEYYWRMNTRRMESQIVRDCLLQLAGQLNPQLGGPSVDVGINSKRRSLYFKHSRDQQDKFLTMFDDADLLQCYRRDESIVPQQALALANSELAITMAAQIAKSIDASRPDQDLELFIRTAFETIIARPATSHEILACLEYCSQLDPLVQKQHPENPEQQAERTRTHLIHSLLNYNDFISIR